MAALILVAMIAVAAWWVLRSIPDPEPVRFAVQRTLPTGATVATLPSAAPSSLVSSPATADGAAQSGHDGGQPLVVDVGGKVRHPGIVELPIGSRVIDALAAAGGARRKVNTSSLNLARPLVDGEQILVGIEVPALPGLPAASSAADPSTGTSSAAPTPINLNTATQEQLETLPGIGPVTAQAILKWRADNGAFSTVDELLEVSGIGDVTLSEIEPFVYV